MRPIYPWLCAGTMVLSLALATTASHAGDPPTASPNASPIFGVTIPDGYRQWQLVAPALEGTPFNELRAVLGNDTAIGAYRDSRLPYPDGTVLVKLAWKREFLPGFDQALVPGPATTVQVMVKDSKKYPATGGWGFGKFSEGKPVDEAEHRTCFTCHEAHVKNHDYVFTRFAP